MVQPIEGLYLALYTFAVLGCGAALLRARTIEEPDTRYGLVGLLAGSGGWALFELGFLVAPPGIARYVTYLLGLIVGLTTVGAWLYFCSAYTGRAFHRNTRYRRLAVGVYLAIVLVKVTNPLHGLYFTVGYTTIPFGHPTVTYGLFHWVVTGLSYSLTAVGFFMLFEQFLEADYDAGPLAALVGLTGLPVAFDILGFVTPYLIEANYEPAGVAMFALGTLYVFEDRFFAVQITDGVEEPVISLDEEAQVRASNGRARALFPALEGAVGEPLERVCPAIAAALEDERGIVDRVVDGTERHYLVSDTTFSLGQSNIGRLVVLSDVTQAERRRRELERHNEQLEGLAAGMRHELLNTLNVVEGRVDMAGRSLADGDVGAARESLAVVSETADGMTAIVDDFARLARHGRTVDSTERVDLREAVRDAHEMASTDGLDVAVEGAATLDADPARLQELLEHAFEFATHHDATTATVRLQADGFSIETDASLPGYVDRERLFALGDASGGAGVDMKLPSVRLLARTHGWDVSLETADTLRITITGVDVTAVNVPPGHA